MNFVDMHGIDEPEKYMWTWIDIAEHETNENDLIQQMLAGSSNSSDMAAVGQNMEMIKQQLAMTLVEDH